MFIGTVLLFESYSKLVESERLDFPQVCAESENTVSVCLATFIKKQEAQETCVISVTEESTKRKKLRIKQKISRSITLEKTGFIFFIY